MKKRYLLVTTASLVCALCVGAQTSFSQENPANDEATATRIQGVVARWRALAEIMLQTDRPDEATDYYVRIAELTGADIDIERASVICLRYKRFEKALPLCERVILIYPDEPLAYYRLAICHEGLGDNAARDGALERASKCTERARNFGGAVNSLWYSQYESMLGRAVEHFWAASAKRMPDANRECDVLARITDSYIAHGEYGKAIKACRQRLSILRLMSRTDGYRNIERQLKRCEALLLFSQGKFEKAAAGFREILEAGGDSLEVCAELYRCLKKLGRNGEAEKVMRAKIGGMLDSISENPEDYNNRNCVAWFYALCRDKTDEGIALAREAVKGAPHNFAYLDTLAELLYQKGEYKEAFEYAQKALGVHPGMHIHFWRQYEKTKAAVDGER